MVEVDHVVDARRPQGVALQVQRTGSRRSSRRGRSLAEVGPVRPAQREADLLARRWRTGSARSATGAEDLVRRFVGRTRTILPATTTIEWLCADALVDAERRIEARIAPSGVLAP